MSKIYVKKMFGKLVPLYESDADKLKAAKLKEGEFYEVEIKKKRNPEFHKKYFALLNLCYDNQDTFDNIDDMRAYITCKSGFYKRIHTGNGDMILPKSISFAKMDNIEFEDLYQNTITQVCNFLGCDRESLIDEILSYA